MRKCITGVALCSFTSLVYILAIELGSNPDQQKFCSGGRVGPKALLCSEMAPNRLVLLQVLLMTLRFIVDFFHYSARDSQSTACHSIFVLEMSSVQRLINL